MVTKATEPHAGPRKRSLAARVPASDNDDIKLLFHVEHFIHFPMQNSLKTLPRTSSVWTSPKTPSSWPSITRFFSARYSGGTSSASSRAISPSASTTPRSRAAGRPSAEHPYLPAESLPNPSSAPQKQRQRVTGLSRHPDRRLRPQIAGQPAQVALIQDNEMGFVVESFSGVSESCVVSPTVPSTTRIQNALDAK